MSFSRFAILPTAAIAILTMACGGNDDGGSAYDGGALLCDVMFDSPHRYSAAVIFDAVAADPLIVEPSGSPSPFHYESTIEASVEDGDTIQATIRNTDGGALDTTIEGVVDGTATFQRNDQGPWQRLDVANPGYVPIPYPPVETCQALAVDFDPASLSGEDEDVNGIPGKRYDLTDFRSDFPDRMPDIGPNSDVSGMVNVFAGSIWVSEAGYISKLDLTGVGTYADGTTLSARFTYVMSDRGADVEVERPAEA